MQQQTLASYARMLVPLPYFTCSREPTAKTSSTDPTWLPLLQNHYQQHETFQMMMSIKQNTKQFSTVQQPLLPCCWLL